MTRWLVTLLALASPWGALLADEVTDTRARQRLEKTEGRALETYSPQPGLPLHDAVKRQQQRKSSVTVDLKSALKPFDSPESESIVPMAPGSQVTIADIRQRALQNNLQIKVAKMDPELARQSLREEQAKFDQVIFAYAKYAEKDTPAMAGDKVILKSDNALLNGELAKLNLDAQKKEFWDVEAGVKVPLRTGGTVTLSAPLENRQSLGKFA
ncbi:MAG TPA: transporter, partial [Methylophilus sp.]|nr:transporter [Methylophilus sp.]